MSREADTDEHRDDAQVLDIIVKTIAEFHIQCDFAASRSIAVLAPRLGVTVNKFEHAHIALGIVKETNVGCAALIIHRLQEQGFAVGMFR